MFLICTLVIVFCNLVSTFGEYVDISNVENIEVSENTTQIFLEKLETSNFPSVEPTTVTTVTTNNINGFEYNTKQTTLESSVAKNATKVHKEKRRRRPLNKRKKTEKRIEEYTTPRNKEIETLSQNTKNVKSTTKILEKEENIKVSTDTSGYTFAPKMFSKRPTEYNPIFKKRTEERAPVAKIINEKNFVYGHNGDFHYSFEDGDGTKVYGQGELKSSYNEKTGESVVGGFFYKDKEGNDYSLSYTADENGYRPVGAHLPTPPPIPPAIARALQHLATKTTPSSVTRAYNDY